MARHGIELSDSQKLLITELVEEKSTLEQIAKELMRQFNLKISLPTLSNHIRGMGLERVDSRSKDKPNRFRLEEPQNNYARSLYENLGLSIKDICENLDVIYKTKVSVKTMAKYINEQGWKRMELPKTEEVMDSDFGDESYESIDGNSAFGEELLCKMRADENLRRFYLYNRGDDYNLYGEKGSVDTWFTRDGFPKIELSHSILFNHNHTDYDAVGGKFRSKYSYESDMQFYTSCGSSSQEGNALAYRKELKQWYANNRREIQRLYDEIIKQNFARDIEEVKLFNALCKELYERNLGYGDIVNGRHSQIQKILRGEAGLSMPNNFLK